MGFVTFRNRRKQAKKPAPVVVDAPEAEAPDPDSVEVATPNPTEPKTPAPETAPETAEPKTPAPETAPETAEPTLRQKVDDMRKAELIEFAKEFGLDFGSSDRVDDIRDAIVAAHD